MSDELAPTPPVRSFNPQAMLGNISELRSMIQRVRQKDGGIGSTQDELILHRAIHDLDLLVDIVDGLKAAYSKLQQEAHAVLTVNQQQQTQLTALRETYETMISERNARIKELEGDSQES